MSRPTVFQAAEDTSITIPQQGACFKDSVFVGVSDQIASAYDAKIIGNV
jgi:hypothetical protein